MLHDGLGLHSQLAWFLFHLQFSLSPRMLEKRPLGSWRVSVPHVDFQASSVVVSAVVWFVRQGCDEDLLRSGSDLTFAGRGDPSF